MMLISVNDLTFSYPKRSRLFEKVTFDLRQGSVVEVRGANGSGKSTFAKLMTGLLRPSQGSVGVNGRILTSLNARRRLELARYVPQRVFEFFLFSTVGAEIEATIRHTPFVYLDDGIFGQFGLGSPLSTNPADLGELESWRLALLLSAITQPQLLFVDEIPSQTSLKCHSALRYLIRHRRSQGLVTLFSTHRTSALSGEATTAIVLRCEEKRIQITSGLAPDTASGNQA